MGLPETIVVDFLAEVGIEGSGQDAIEQLVQQAVHTLANDGEMSAVALSPLSHTGSDHRFQAGLHHFGLSFDEEGSRLSRAGTSEFALLDQKQPYKLFRYFIEHYDERLTLARLRDNWHVVGIGREFPGKSTIYNAVSKLGGLILPVRLDMENKHDSGWKIVCPPTD
jgi:hypothetical protein